MNTQPNTTSINSANTTPLNTNTSNQKVTYTAGETITLNNLEITVNDISVKDKISERYWSYSPKDGCKYLVADITIKNIGESPEEFLPISGGRLKVKVVYQERYDYVSTNLITHDDDLHMTYLNPLTSKAGIIVFEIPDEVIDSPEEIALQFYIYGSGSKIFSYKIVE